MPIDPQDPRAPYLQIADDLRQAIADGTLEAGDKLPSARELMDDYEVSTTTAQGALRKLRNEGLTYSVHGRGTFVVTDGTARWRAQTHGGFPNPLEPSGAPSPEYVQLREELDRLAQQIEQIHQRLDSIETGRTTKRRRTPAKKS